MKNCFLLIALISIVCWSCDGRQTKKEALQHAVSEFNLKSLPLEMASYQPEAYVEIITDTIIENSVKVHIKNFSLLDQQILLSTATEPLAKQRHYQRIFESEISISTLSKTILSTHISAKQFKAIDSDPFWDHATLQHAWLNQELSTINDIRLDVSFVNPINKAYKLYRMSIDLNGQHSYNLLEERI